MIFLYFRVGFATLSVLGCLANYFEFLLIKISRTNSNILILLKQSSNLMIAASLVMPKMNFLCYLQSFLLEAGIIASIISNLLSSWYLYLKHVKLMSSIKKYITWWIFLNLIFPFFISALLIEFYEDSDYNFCWLKVENSYITIPHIVLVLGSFMVQVFVLYKVYKKYKPKNVNSYKLIKLFYDTIIFGISYVAFILLLCIFIWKWFY